MTHSDIYTKFMIEYDKANITSSYPSLTKYEIATILDKAYLALIAQKFTGNNPRRVSFEGDIKAIEDLAPLITRKDVVGKKDTEIGNQFTFTLPTDLLYYVQGLLSHEDVEAVDNVTHGRQYVHLYSHEDANKFKATPTNLPWIKEPVGYMWGDNISVLVDPYEDKDESKTLTVRYIKEPTKFTTTVKEDTANAAFELSDTMAEELINMAIVMSTETVESSRLQTKTNLRPLES